ncbi:MAG: VWA domain-containing protein [Ignavibacteria bacterium]|nr:VWA domain-containing protein [Ignavibacteria bacterium]
MNISDGKGNRLNRAKNISLSIIDAFREGDEVSIITANTIMDNIPAPVSTNFALVKQEIDKIQPIPNRFPLRSALSHASTILHQSHNLVKEVYILTDAQINIIEESSDSLLNFQKGIGIFALPLGNTSENIGENISVDSVRILTNFVHKDTPVEVEALIRNDSDKDIQGVVVSCHFNKRRVAQKSIDLAKKEKRAITFSAVPNNDGIIQGFIELENDIFVTDNKRFFSINVPSPPTVAIIGTQQNAGFTDIALLTGEKATRSLQRFPQFFSPTASVAIDWDNLQTVIVTDYISDRTTEARLRQF